MKAIKALATAIFMMGLSTTAMAAHSTYNPMAPRQISVVASEKDYSYGLTVLAGNSIDSVDPFFRYVGWYPNYYVLDRYLLRPVAHAYAKLPDPIQSGVGNFFQNLQDINNSVNHLFVGDLSSSGVSVSRLAINSTLGILGLVDVASYIGLDYREMTMDTVFGKAGMDQGMYMMMPILGPYTERSAHADAIDNWPYYIMGNPWISAILWTVETVHDRSKLIPQESVVDNAFDPYIATRQVYLMYTEGKVNPNASMQEQQSDENVESYLDEIDSI